MTEQQYIKILKDIHTLKEGQSKLRKEIKILKKEKIMKSTVYMIDKKTNKVMIYKGDKK